MSITPFPSFVITLYAMNGGEFERFDLQKLKPELSPRSKQKEPEAFPQAFSVLINYWEIKPSQYEARLQELVLKDVHTVSAFVPWAHVETDIYHSLQKFVRAAATVRLKVRLFVMPEPGVNYPNGGIPKEIFQNNSHLAVDAQGRVLYNLAAPNIFPLPSFFSQDVLKRFGNFLIKVASILGDVFSEVSRSDFCEVIVSNSYFNYYRHPTSLQAMEHGDYAAAHVMAFRDFLDKEYQGPSSETFKMQIYELYNRHRFATYVENLLREKSEMMFVKKSSQCQVRHLNLLNPECAPGMGYDALVTELFHYRPSVQKFYELILQAATRRESIFLNGAGVFRRFTDQEKSFLILASLIHAGEVVLGFEELTGLSQAFQRKFRDLVNLIEEQSFVRQGPMVYVAASPFAADERCTQTLHKMAPGIMTMLAGVSALGKKYSTAKDRDINTDRLVFVDPKTVIRLVDVVQLLGLAQAGRTVVIPGPTSKIANYMSDAAVHLDKFRKGRQPLKLGLGLSYEVFDYNPGMVVVYNPESFWVESEGAARAESANLVMFFQAVLGLANVTPSCRINNSNLHVVSYHSQKDSSTKLLFLINPTTEALSVTMTFPEVVALQSLAQFNAASGGEVLVGKSFELAAPARGVLSMVAQEPSVTQMTAEREAQESASQSEVSLWN